MKCFSIGQFSKQVGRSIPTLRVWDERGILKPDHISPGGHRYYSEEQVYQVLNRKKTTEQKIVIGYCRVSTKKQKDDLDRQIGSVKTYMLAKGYSFEVISDIGSGINYNKSGLNDLINRIITGKVERIVLLYKDRLVRFGYELIESLCKRFDVSIEIIDNSPRSEEQELVEDLIQIVTVFSCRLQGKRANRAKKILEEVKGLADDESPN